MTVNSVLQLGCGVCEPGEVFDTMVLSDAVFDEVVFRPTHEKSIGPFIGPPACQETCERELGAEGSTFNCDIKRIAKDDNVVECHWFYGCGVD